MHLTFVFICTNLESAFTDQYLADCVLLYLLSFAEYTLGPRTKVLDPSMSFIQCDGANLVLPSTSETASYSVGDTIVSVMDSSSTLGATECTLISRTITKVTVLPSGIALETVAADVSDIFKTAKIDIPSIVNALSLDQGSGKRRSLLGNSIFGIGNVGKQFLFFQKGEAINRLVIDGFHVKIKEISVVPDVSFTFEKDSNGYSTSLGIFGDLSLTFDLDVDAGLSFKGKGQIAKGDLFSVKRNFNNVNQALKEALFNLDLVDFTFAIGPIPFYAALTLGAFLKTDLLASMSFTISDNVLTSKFGVGLVFDLIPPYQHPFPTDPVPFRLIPGVPVFGGGCQAEIKVYLSGEMKVYVGVGIRKTFPNPFGPDIELFKDLVSAGIVLDAGLAFRGAFPALPSLKLSQHAKKLGFQGTCADPASGCLANNMQALFGIEPVLELNFKISLESGLKSFAVEHGFPYDITLPIYNAFDDFTDLFPNLAYYTCFKVPDTFFGDLCCATPSPPPG